MLTVQAAVLLLQIAADFYEHGLDTTIVQRSSTYVMSSE